MENVQNTCSPVRRKEYSISTCPSAWRQEYLIPNQAHWVIFSNQQWQGVRTCMLTNSIHVFAQKTHLPNNSKCLTDRVYDCSTAHPTELTALTFTQVVRASMHVFKLDVEENVYIKCWQVQPYVSPKPHTFRSVSTDVGHCMYDSMVPWTATS